MKHLKEFLLSLKNDKKYSFLELIIAILGVLMMRNGTSIILRLIGWFLYLISISGIISSKQ